MYDIVIIGLGPAGSTFARLLGDSYKVAAIDLKGENASFRKPCGGLLAPDAQKALAKFNLNLPIGVLVTPQIFSVKTIDVKSSLIRYYQRFYLNCDRHRFDMWLISLIHEKMDIFDNSRCKKIVETEEGYEVTFSKNGVNKTIKAKYIVGADGSNSIVRRTFFNRPIRRYMAIQQWFDHTENTQFYSCVFDEMITDCYAWSDSKDGKFIFGAALPLKNSKLSFDRLKEKMEKFGYTFGKVLKTEACMVSRPSSTKEVVAGGKGVFLIGEAAGLISPSSLEGISYAMDSAYDLYQAFVKDFNNPMKYYKKRVLLFKVKIFIKLVKSIFMYVPFIRRLVMRSRFTAISKMN